MNSTNTTTRTICFETKNSSPWNLEDWNVTRRLLCCCFCRLDTIGSSPSLSPRDCSPLAGEQPSTTRHASLSFRLVHANIGVSRTIGVCGVAHPAHSSLTSRTCRNQLLIVYPIRRSLFLHQQPSSCSLPQLARAPPSLVLHHQIHC
jgi:hypothetical protein